MSTRRDPVTAYVAALEKTLRGPRRATDRLVTDIREGLTDTTDAYVAEGMSRHEAGDRAVRDFGPVRELAAVCQRELTLAQARETARAAAVSVPLLLACWFLARGAVGGAAAPVALLAVLALLLAAVVPALTTGPLARRLPAPRVLPRLVAWASTAVGTGMGAAVLGLGAAVCLTGEWVLTVPALALAAASHAVMGGAARGSRRCLVVR
ncbi:permease prefix domain 1-containing protein [Streptomyces sp. enrichment culture]|uniref:permease prefix domain 1-containing protein n=1 Tax=Streptomyces sp. enrichment culture TaxID=1795815 RepID=UPI003F57323D